MPLVFNLFHALESTLITSPRKCTLTAARQLRPTGLLAALALLGAGACAREAHDPGSAKARVSATRQAGSPATTPATTPDTANTATPPVQAAAAPAVRTFGELGLSTPESVLYDAKADRYLVSNIVGAPLSKDGDAFITWLQPDGSLKQLRWIDAKTLKTPLNAPKGMALLGDTLWVTDIDHLRAFDRQTGAALKDGGDIEIPGATFLNDLCTGPDGALYVSDTGMKAGPKGFSPSGSDAIYRVTVDGKAQVQALARGPRLGHPNGLTFLDKTLWVVTFGSNKLYALEGGKVTKQHTLPGGSLDGLEADAQGRLIVSSWETSSVYRLTLGKKDNEIETLATKLSAPADLDLDRKRNLVLIPRFKDNAVTLFPLP